MNEFFREWSPLLAIILAPTFGIVAARWNRKSQAEANNLAGTGQIFTHQNTLLQDIQEERDKAKEERDSTKRELKAEREANARDIGTLRQEFESFKESVKSQFSGYRAYIHGLRGQVHELGGVPIEWPKDLDQ